MADKMLPKDVADAFLKQYYVILNRCPENVHKFYQESSQLGWPGSDGVVTPVTTLSGIYDKIMSSEYKNCSAEIKTFDSQDSMDGGIIISVTGYLTLNNNSEKQFYQTFFLAKQEKGFYVLNDILRVFDPNVPIIGTLADLDGANGLLALSTQASCDTPDSSTSLLAKLDLEDGNVKEVTEISVSKEEESAGKESASASLAAPSESDFPAIMRASNAKVPSIVSQTPVVYHKITYASVLKVAKDPPVTTPRAAKVTSDAYKQAAVSQKVKPSVAIGDGSPKSNVAQKLPTSGNTALNAGAYGEARRIYIGRLPYDITKQGVVDVVKQFGPIRKNLDNIQIMRYEDGFCCGFVEFQSADSARRAVEAHRIKFGDKEAYVTYKRSSSSRGGSRSPTRAGNEVAKGAKSPNNHKADYGHVKGGQRSRSTDKWSRIDSK